MTGTTAALCRRRQRQRAIIDDDVGGDDAATTGALLPVSRRRLVVLRRLNDTAPGIAALLLRRRRQRTALPLLPLVVLVVCALSSLLLLFSSSYAAASFASSFASPTATRQSRSGWVFLSPASSFVGRDAMRGGNSRRKTVASSSTLTAPPFATALGISRGPDDDPEMINEDGDDAYTFAPRTERDGYVSEAEQAQQANDAVAVATASSNSDNSPSIELQTEVSNSFLQYALSIILGRAIPDARDGLKPVHRRILYAMRELGLSPSSSHRKCARVVGEVLGKFHPHGDVAVYDALVRLAQQFATAYPLVDGHGNFGSIDNDPAAAMRYTECKLTPFSQACLMDELHASTVDFLPNFDGNEVEPSVLPARVPVLLLNGCAGIAVGMATNIPPHNLNEILTACRALVAARRTGDGAGPSVTDEQLYRMVPGPDFPTGASILGTAGARQLYSTGNGGVVMRATTEIEKIVSGRKGNTQRTAIIVTQLPYQVNKAALLEKIAAMVNDKRLDGIADLRDESDRDGIRVVIELKRDAVAAVVLNNLYKKTPLQTTFSGNFLALMTPTPAAASQASGTDSSTVEENTADDSSSSSSSLVPQRFTLRQALDCFLDFRFDTIRRKTRYELKKVEERAHIVEGLLLALLKVDTVIEIVRSASDQKDARQLLQEELGTSEEQTDAIMRLQLGQLTRLNSGKLQDEKADLETSREKVCSVFLRVQILLFGLCLS